MAVPDGPERRRGEVSRHLPEGPLSQRPMMCGKTDPSSGKRELQSGLRAPSYQSSAALKALDQLVGVFQGAEGLSCL